VQIKWKDAKNKGKKKTLMGQPAKTTKAKIEQKINSKKCHSEKYKKTQGKCKRQ